MVENDYFVLNGLWEKYGLCIANHSYRSLSEIAEATHYHNLVANYLENHPDVAAEYRKTKRYYDVLNLAEKENKIS